MPDDVKVIITERNGSDIENEELALTGGNIPFSDPAYIADNIEEAIVESASKGGQSRYVVPCGYESTVQNGRWLEFHRGNPSNDTPYIATETTELIARSFSIPATKVSVTVTIYINDVSVETVVLSNDMVVSATFITPLALTINDMVSIQKTAGDNPASITAYPHFKVPF